MLYLVYNIWKWRHLIEKMEQTSRLAKDNQSTDKVLAIIEFLSRCKEPMRLIDISNQLHYNTSTTLRFLNSLERNGYVYKDKETLKYQMTYKLCGLASYISNRTGIVEIASLPMKKLSANLGMCMSGCGAGLHRNICSCG